MRALVRTSGVKLTGKLAEHIDDKLRHALSRFRGRMGKVHVVIQGIAGPAGSKDVHCIVRANVPGAGDLVADGIHHEPFAAVASAVSRVSRGISRRLLSRRRDPRPAVAAPSGAVEEVAGP